MTLIVDNSGGYIAAPPVEEVEAVAPCDILRAHTVTGSAVIRRRRSTARRAWGPIARFFLRHLFRGMNR